MAMFGLLTFWRHFNDVCGVVEWLISLNFILMFVLVEKTISRSFSEVKQPQEWVVLGWV